LLFCVNHEPKEFQAMKVNKYFLIQNHIQNKLKLLAQVFISRAMVGPGKSAKTILSRPNIIKTARGLSPVV